MTGSKEASHLRHLWRPPRRGGKRDRRIYASRTGRRKSQRSGPTRFTASRRTGIQAGIASGQRRDCAAPLALRDTADIAVVPIWERVPIWANLPYLPASQRTSSARQNATAEEEHGCCSRKSGLVQGTLDQALSSARRLSVADHHRREGTVHRTEQALLRSRYDSGQLDCQFQGGIAATSPQLSLQQHNLRLMGHSLVEPRLIHDRTRRRKAVRQPRREHQVLFS